MRLSVILFLFSYAAAFSQVRREYTVILRSNIGTHAMWDGEVVRIFGMTSMLSEFPSIPARTLYANEGDTVVLNARNVSQGEHHTIHLHGLDVDTRNDGDPATSFWLEHMEDTTYTFIATHPGTYIYHCHVADVVHVQMGMYGLIVVNAAGGAKQAWTGGPAYDRDFKWLTSEIDKSWHDTIPVHDPLTDTLSLPPFKPEYFLVNGKSRNQLGHDSVRITGSVGEKLYLRTANIGYFNNRIIFPASLSAEVISSDGRPLPNPYTADTLLVMPGERYGIMLSPSAEISLTALVQFLDMNTDSIWDTEYVPVEIQGFAGTQEQPQRNFKVYPNPASTKVSFSIPGDSKNCTVEVFGTDGKLAGSYELEGNDERRIAVSDLANGLYLIRVSTAEGIYSARFLIAR